MCDMDSVGFNVQLDPHLAKWRVVVSTLEVSTLSVSKQ